MLRICDETFPFVFAVVSGDITDADIDEMARRYAALHQRKQRFYLVQEVRQVKIPSAAMRKRLADLNTEFGERIAKNIVGIGIIVPSRVVSAAMTAIYWVSKEAAPTRFFPSAAAMAEHARQACAKERLQLPPALETVAGSLDAAWQEGRSLLEVDCSTKKPVHAA